MLEMKTPAFGGSLEICSHFAAYRLTGYLQICMMLSAWLASSEKNDS
jgi:hypothetical protein